MVCFHEEFQLADLVATCLMSESLSFVRWPLLCKLKSQTSKIMFLTGQKVKSFKYIRRKRFKH